MTWLDKQHWQDRVRLGGWAPGPAGSTAARPYTERAAVLRKADRAVSVLGDT